MTLIELGIQIFFVTCGLETAVVLHQSYGRAWGIAGFFLGYLGGVCLLWFVTALVRLIEWLWPPKPICVRGSCRLRDFERIATTDDGEHRRCRCGDEYLMANSYSVLLRKLPDGTYGPFMKCHPIWGWKSDDGSAPSRGPTQQ